MLFGFLALSQEHVVGAHKFLKSAVSWFYLIVRLAVPETGPRQMAGIIGEFYIAYVFSFPLLTHKRHPGNCHTILSMYFAASTYSRSH